MDNRKTKKYGIVITEELFRRILGIPDIAEFSITQDYRRDQVNLRIRTKENLKSITVNGIEVPLYQVGEGQEYPHYNG